MFDNEFICKRCGILWVSNQRKSKQVYCSDCRARPAKTVRYNGEICNPWHGDFDEFERPILNGLLFMPGDRICGHSDCVNGLHLKLSDE